MLSFENVARNAQRQPEHEPMYDAVKLYLASLPPHPRAFIPLPVQHLHWTLPFEPVTPLTAENTVSAPFTTKKALQNKSNPTRHSPFAEINKPMVRLWQAPQGSPHWLRPPPPPPPLLHQPSFLQSSSGSWSAWMPPPQSQHVPQQTPQPMTVRPLQSELSRIQHTRTTTHRPPTLHSNVTLNPMTMTAHGEIPQETELTTATRGMRINAPPESPNSSRGRNNHHGNNNHNNKNNHANSQRRRNRKRHTQLQTMEPVHKDTHILPQYENEENPPTAVFNNISENRKEGRPFGHFNRAAEGGDEIMHPLGRGGGQAHRGGPAGRGGGGGGRSGRRHRPVNVDQPTQQTLTLPPLRLFSNGTTSKADAPPPLPTMTTTITTPRAHQTRQQQQQNNESFRHSRRISGNNARRGRTDSMVAN